MLLYTEKYPDTHMKRAKNEHKIEVSQKVYLERLSGLIHERVIMHLVTTSMFLPPLLITKCKGRTGRITAEDLSHESSDWMQRGPY